MPIPPPRTIRRYGHACPSNPSTAPSSCSASRSQPSPSAIPPRPAMPARRRIRRSAPARAAAARARPPEPLARAGLAARRGRASLHVTAAGGTSRPPPSTRRLRDRNLAILWWLSHRPLAAAPLAHPRPAVAALAAGGSTTCTARTRNPRPSGYLPPAPCSTWNTPACSTRGAARSCKPVELTRRAPPPRHRLARRSSCPPLKDLRARTAPSPPRSPTFRRAGSVRPPAALPSGAG